MAKEQMKSEVVNREPAALDAAEIARRKAEREKAAALAELISARFRYRRQLLSFVDRDPAPAVLEALYAKHPDLRGSPMFEPKRCSFCGGATREKLSTMIEGHNSARICHRCARVIVDEVEGRYDDIVDDGTSEAAHKE